VLPAARLANRPYLSFWLWGTLALRLSARVPESQKLNKYVRLRELTYIHTCRCYVHTPCELDRHAVEWPTGIFIVFTRWPIGPILGFWGSIPPKWEIPCLIRRWTAVQNLSPLALSSAEKSVTVQTNKQTNNTQTVNDISIHLAYWHVLIKMVG